MDGFNAKTTGATTFNVRDDVTKSLGTQTLKAGIYIRRIDLNMYFSQSGTAAYDNAQKLLANQMHFFAVQAAWPMSGMRKTQYFGYVQDEWKITPNLTVNAGMRYSYFAPFTEVHGNDLPFDLNACGGYCARGSEFFNPDFA